MRIPLRVLIAFISIATLISSCTNERQRTFDRITQLQDSLYDKESGIVNVVNANRFVELVGKYIEQHPKDKLEADLIVKSIQVAQIVNDLISSLELIEYFLKNYPTHQHYKMVLFNKGYVYEGIGDLENARISYNQFLTEYPNDEELSITAKRCIQNLGKTPDEIMEGFAGVPTDSLP